MHFLTFYENLEMFSSVSKTHPPEKSRRFGFYLGGEEFAEIEIQLAFHDKELLKNDVLRRPNKWKL